MGFNGSLTIVREEWDIIHSMSSSSADSFVSAREPFDAEKIVDL